MSCVIDASIMVSFLMNDEDSELSVPIVAPLLNAIAHVPSLWIYEMASAFRIAERRQRITPEDTPMYLDSLKVLMIDHHHPDPQKMVEISRDTGLSIYDSAYIALCLKEQLPLATLDKKMKSVAEQLGIKVLS
ncbi:MAG: PIN domain-containing protein [Actinobacteria bacterium]|uniref:Unannotated protein n=1 Tax=freshwater metagenome TaxID=449393 RepID=A0A6J7SQ93_9ZZZZ|nr:PIN domain-containing protein [Actinomycetota bacterium]